MHMKSRIIEGDVYSLRYLFDLHCLVAFCYIEVGLRSSELSIDFDLR